MSTRFVHRHRRRAASALFVLITLPVLAGFAAITVDVGLIYNTRADLQNTADAAAMAAAHAFTTEAMMKVRMRTESTGAFAEVIEEAFRYAQELPETGYTFGGKRILVERSEMSLGWLNLGSATAPLNSGLNPATYNGVRIEARRTKESVNGSLQLFFARIFGQDQTEVTASAVAVFDDRFGGFDAGSDRMLLWPFTKNIDEYEAQLTTGGDDYEYDEDAEAVSPGSDGTREIILYPGDEAPGNYGLLNIGSTSLSNDELAAQVVNGITTSDLESAFGTSDLSFFDEYGSPTPYDVPGNTGLKAKLEESVQLRIGDIVGFFVHDLVTNAGANATYRIVGMRFGRVMNVALQTSAKDRGLWIQPIAYDGTGVSTNANAPSSRGGAGRVVLAR